MSEITAAAVKELREKTGAGMMDCKKALKEAGGNLEEAVDVLRKMGLKDVGNRSGKITAEGTIGVYSHQGDQIVSIVELNCETDFVGRSDAFKEVARGVAMHVAAMKPLYLSIEQIPAAVLAKEKEIVLETLNEKQKAMADKIVPGKLAKFYEETVLLEQSYVRDDSGSQKVRNVIEDLSAKLGEKITLRRFQRFEVGEGVDRSSENLADEVAATIAGA